MHLRSLCLSTMGQELADAVTFSSDADLINLSLQQTTEFRHLSQIEDDFPAQYFFDLREPIGRLRIEGTRLETPELFDLRRMLTTLEGIVRILNKKSDETNFDYPTLHALSTDVRTFPDVLRNIDRILNKFGEIKDDASDDLLRIRRDLKRQEGSISRLLNTILHQAQQEGFIEKDVTPSMRDGRLVIPVAAAQKRKLRGIVHDESATGRTVFIEPAEVVEANNKIRELQNDERREISRILTVFSDELRPDVPDLLNAIALLGDIDFIRAKALLANDYRAIEPELHKSQAFDWVQAVHPLLRQSLEKQNKQTVPLDINLNPQKRILLISGPNAGGKSVCLKTVALLQYMVQCGLSIPLRENSTVGIFQNILIDIGDEQSIENDLSTYSSHLLNMKNMMRAANNRTLLLIDEFGTGTEPQIGGAIAQAVLAQFCKKKAYAIITTHYSNLKHFAEEQNGIENGAMLYDRQGMRPLFQLQIGQPGSSFAIEIARKIGLPDEVINEASEIVGSDYIQSDKYLQDIVRDKRYWENKRQNIHQHEKDMQRTIERYENEIRELETKRKEIIRQAKEEAEELLRESNRRIENTIKEIRESQAEKEKVKLIREGLQQFKEEVAQAENNNDELIARKMAQIQRRKERKEKRKKDKAKPTATPLPQQPEAQAPLQVGDYVKMKGIDSVGKIESIDQKKATVVFGDIRTHVKIDQLERTNKRPKPASQSTETSAQTLQISRSTRDAIDEHRKKFKPEIDIRGMRADEALTMVRYFIDDAILVGMSRVRILHGKGDGILRQLVREYLATEPNVSQFSDEHVQFGGNGITVVDLK